MPHIDRSKYRLQYWPIFFLINCLRRTYDPPVGGKRVGYIVNLTGPTLSRVIACTEEIRRRRGKSSLAYTQDINALTINICYTNHKLMFAETYRLNFHTKIGQNSVNCYIPKFFAKLIKSKEFWWLFHAIRPISLNWYMICGFRALLYGSNFCLVDLNFCHYVDSMMVWAAI